jgi:hypothetical protein
LQEKLQRKGVMCAAATQALWPRRGSSNRRWPEHEIVQQPVRLHRPESANVVEMPDFIGCFQFFAF